MLRSAVAFALAASAAAFAPSPALPRAAQSESTSQSSLFNLSSFCPEGPEFCEIRVWRPCMTKWNW
eukprot:765640-Hanusia_phi.AAC.5